MRPILFKPVKILLPEDDKRIEFVPVNLEKTPLEDFSKELFGIPLRLKWYKICLDNQNEVAMNEVKIQLPYAKDPETGAMEMQINFRGGTNYKIYTPINRRTCDYVKAENAIADIKMNYRKPLSNSFNPTFKVYGSKEKGSTAVVEQSSFVYTDKSSFRVSNIWSEMIYKMLIFVFGWIVLVVGVRDSWQMCAEPSKKK